MIQIDDRDGPEVLERVVISLSLETSRITKSNEEEGVGGVIVCL